MNISRSYRSITMSLRLVPDNSASNSRYRLRDAEIYQNITGYFWYVCKNECMHHHNRHVDWWGFSGSFSRPISFLSQGSPVLDVIQYCSMDYMVNIYMGDIMCAHRGLILESLLCLPTVSVPASSHSRGTSKTPCCLPKCLSTRYVAVATWLAIGYRYSLCDMVYLWWYKKEEGYSQ